MPVRPTLTARRSAHISFSREYPADCRDRPLQVSEGPGGDELLLGHSKATIARAALFCRREGACRLRHPSPCVSHALADDRCPDPAEGWRSNLLTSRSVRSRCTETQRHVAPERSRTKPHWTGSAPVPRRRTHTRRAVPGHRRRYPAVRQPGQARALSAALLRAADAADTEAFYRQPVTPGWPRPSRSAVCRRARLDASPPDGMDRSGAARPPGTTP